MKPIYVEVKKSRGQGQGHEARKTNTSADKIYPTTTNRTANTCCCRITCCVHRVRLERRTNYESRLRRCKRILYDRDMLQRRYVYITRCLAARCLQRVNCWYGLSMTDNRSDCVHNSLLSIDTGCSVDTVVPRLREIGVVHVL